MSVCTAALCSHVAKNLKLKGFMCIWQPGSKHSGWRLDEEFQDTTLTRSFQQLVDAHYAVLNEAQFQVNCVLQTIGHHVSLIRLNTHLPAFSWNGRYAVKPAHRQQRCQSWCAFISKEECALTWLNCDFSLLVISSSHWCCTAASNNNLN